MKHSISRAPFQIKWGTIGAIGLLSVAAGLVISGAWLSVEFILDPRSVVWLNHYLPDGAKIPIVGSDELRTLAELQEALKKTGRTIGDPILLESNLKSAKNSSDLLLPVLTRQENCDLDCDRVTELRVYRLVAGRDRRGKPDYLQLISQLPISGIDETFVLTPFAEAEGNDQGSTRSLPLTTLQQFEERAPGQGIWLNLSGQRSQRDKSAAYGEIVHYNPGQTYLNVLLRWTSPIGEAPVWQKRAKGMLSTLVVNQSIGLEPNFAAYQVRARKFTPDPLQLLPVSLTEPALENGAFVDAISLARNGLWSTALEFLRSVKKRQPPSEWSAAAQAQMDLVERHAQVTQLQASQPWVSVSQQVLVSLIDGRWAKATQVLQVSPDDRDEITNLLKSDSGRLWKRVSALLKVNPTRQDVQTWGALILMAQQDKVKAIAWLKKQPQEAATSRAQIIKLLNQVDGTSDANPSNLNEKPKSPAVQDKKATP
ncbi:MAG: hypothetical protein LH702_07285 [Phormidesmis sp. CAN_BIN44]|nr:hypothetical protein [Phormidesmis sp. CAN_BIN44]